MGEIPDKQLLGILFIVLVAFIKHSINYKMLIFVILCVK